MRLSPLGRQAPTPVWRLSSGGRVAAPCAPPHHAPPAARGQWRRANVWVTGPLPRLPGGSGGQGLPGFATSSIATRSTKTRRDRWSAPCAARWMRCGSCCWHTAWKPPITGRNARGVLLLCGVNAPRAPTVTTALAGSNASCRSQNPAGDKRAPPTPGSSTRSVAPSTGTPQYGVALCRSTLISFPCDWIPRLEGCYAF